VLRRLRASVRKPLGAKLSDAMIVDLPRPLHNLPVVRSRDVEEARSWFARAHTAPLIVPARRADAFDATINGRQFQNMGLFYVTFGAAIELKFQPADLFCQLFPISGRGEITFGRSSFGLTGSTGAVSPPNVPVSAHLSADYEHLVLRVNARALTEKLVAMTGVALSEPLRMEAQQSAKHPAAQMLQHYLPLFADTLNRSTPPFPDWWTAQTEQLLMTLFLCAHRHNYSHLLEQQQSDAAPLQIRRAEEYIEANARRAITLEELADITGVSAFSLFSSFRKYRGYSPSDFLSQVRSRRGRGLQ
jgi:AraC-binding-like domain